jgi:hypothetical protein
MPELAFKPVSRKTDLVTQTAGNELLIYDLTVNKAFCLNESISIIWQACDGHKNISELADYLSKQFDSAINEDFVWFALEQLKKDNLIENTPEIFMPFEGLSRREIIRQIGFASLIALPVISSLIAPTAIQAASACVTAGNTTCRCPCPSTLVNGTCGQGTPTPTNAACNPNCTCTRTGAACPTTGPSAGTALGSCA